MVLVRVSRGVKMHNRMDIVVVVRVDQSIIIIVALCRKEIMVVRVDQGIIIIIIIVVLCRRETSTMWTLIVRKMLRVLV